MPKQTVASTHPPIRPSEADAIACLRLLRSRRVGPATYRRLISEHGSAAAALDALPEIARAAGAADYEVCPEAGVIAELNAGRRNRAKLLISGFTDYPHALNTLSDAPPILWTMGKIDLLTRPLIALVGARNASSLGTRMAKHLARELGEAGFVVVSGLARGVDTAAHMGSLATGNIAVQAGGVDTL